MISICLGRLEEKSVVRLLESEKANKHMICGPHPGTVLCDWLHLTHVIKRCSGPVQTSGWLVSGSWSQGLQSEEHCVCLGIYNCVAVYCDVGLCVCDILTRAVQKLLRVKWWGGGSSRLIHAEGCHQPPVPHFCLLFNCIHLFSLHCHSVF